MKLALTSWGYNQLKLQKAGYSPNECCAILLGRQIDGTRIVENICPIQNLSESGQFLMHPQQQLNIIQGTKFGGGSRFVDVMAYYHSHPPNCLGIPSSIDKQKALEGWAIAIHLIHGEDGLRGWWWDGEEFTEIEVQIR